eukprot:4443108-Amphidinium_carterae.1
MFSEAVRLEVLLGLVRMVDRCSGSWVLTLELQTKAWPGPHSPTLPSNHTWALEGTWGCMRVSHQNARSSNHHVECRPRLQRTGTLQPSSSEVQLPVSGGNTLAPSRCKLAERTASGSTLPVVVPSEDFLAAIASTYTLLNDEEGRGLLAWLRRSPIWQFLTHKTCGFLGINLRRPDVRERITLAEAVLVLDAPGHPVCDSKSHLTNPADSFFRCWPYCM